MMNEGATLDTILQTVRAPADLLDRPYLGPIYDEPEFVIRNVWRLFGGWYDGDPSHLKPPPTPRPSPPRSPTLAGGARALAARAEALAAAGDLRLAAQLVELAAQAEPDDAVGPRRPRRGLPAAGRGRGVGDGPGRVRVGRRRVGTPRRGRRRRRVADPGDG